MGAVRTMSDPGAFLGALALAVALGSLHAFSVLLVPLERQVDSDRTAVSLIYSAAIVALTLGVLVSDALRRRLAPSPTALAVAVVAGLGLCLAGLSRSYMALIVGFGLMFGLANGVGYALFLREASRAMPDRPGLAIGVSTACYAAGAMIFSWGFAALTKGGSAGPALLAASVTTLGAGLFGWLMFVRSIDASVASAAVENGVARRASHGLTIKLWLIYFLGATGGLMAIAHAAGIVARLGATGDLIAQSAVAIAVGNAGGSVFGGSLADHLSERACIAAALLLGGLSSLVIASATTATLAVAALLVSGIAYGALIALVPAVVARLATPGAAAHVFSRVFTAWGAAGLLGPWFAGACYDLSGHYRFALAGAAALSAVGAVASLVLLRRSTGAPANS